jgi:hypothetical protein
MSTSFVLKQKHHNAILMSLRLRPKTMSPEDILLEDEVRILEKIEKSLAIYIKKCVGKNQISDEGKKRYKEDHVGKLTKLKKNLMEIAGLRHRKRDEFQTRIYRQLAKTYREELNHKGPRASFVEFIASERISLTDFLCGNHKEAARFGALAFDHFIATTQDVIEAVEYAIQRSEQKRIKPSREARKLVRDLERIWTKARPTDVSLDEKRFMRFIDVTVVALNDNRHNVKLKLYAETALANFLEERAKRGDESDASDEEADFQDEEEDSANLDAGRAGGPPQ